MISSIWRGLPQPLRTAIRRVIPKSVTSYLAQRLRSAQQWDEDYVAGRWDSLADEMPRFAVVSGYCRNFGSVLDIGCGRGLLYDWLTATNRPYVGLDISSIAIEQARQQERVAARFEVADMTTFEIDQRFDVIVFNEVLFYASNPMSVVQRAINSLQPNGVLLISMYDTDETRRTWQHCADDLVVLDETRLIHRDTQWTVRLCRPKVPHQ